MKTTTQITSSSLWNKRINKPIWHNKTNQLTQAPFNLGIIQKTSKAACITVEEHHAAKNNSLIIRNFSTNSSFKRKVLKVGVGQATWTIIIKAVEFSQMITTQNYKKLSSVKICFSHQTIQLTINLLTTNAVGLL